MNLLALITAASLISGIRIESMEMGILAAGILGLVNAIMRPVVLILTLPINVLTLGLFTLVINAAMLKLVSVLVPGLVIDSFRAAFFGALIISLVSWVLNIFVSGNGKVVFIKRAEKDNDGG
jgi:putative membrane protein